MGDDLSVALNTDNKSDSRQIRLVAEIFAHPKFNPHSMLNDVAIIRLAQPFATTATFRPVRLSTDTPPSGAFCKVAGWGRTKEGGDTTERLRSTHIKVMHRDECNDRKSYNGLVREKMFCAGFLIGGRDACQGDSGGGLYCNAGDEVVSGVVSFGYGCAKAHFPGVYVDVSEYRDFIENAMDGKGGSESV